MLIQIDPSPIKNPAWEVYTPNELYESEILSLGKLGQSYQDFISAWKKKNKIGGKNNWFEVRITRAGTQEKIHDSRAWWRQKEFMDRIFWVFQHPDYMIIGGERYFVYTLEPLESLRVVNVAINKFGYNPFGAHIPVLNVPVECCQLAWTETSNGYSDHGRPREEKIPTQEEIEKDKILEEKVDKLLGEELDLSGLDDKDLDSILGPEPE